MIQALRLCGNKRASDPNKNAPWKENILLQTGSNNKHPERGLKEDYMVSGVINGFQAIPKEGCHSSFPA